jgi:hypothetical protein
MLDRHPLPKDWDRFTVYSARVRELLIHGETMIDAEVVHALALFRTNTTVPLVKNLETLTWTPTLPQDGDVALLLLSQSLIKLIMKTSTPCPKFSQVVCSALRSSGLLRSLEIGNHESINADDDGQVTESLVDFISQLCHLESLIIDNGHYINEDVFRLLANSSQLRSLEIQGCDDASPRFAKDLSPHSTHFPSLNDLIVQAPMDTLQDIAKLSPKPRDMSLHAVEDDVREEDLTSLMMSVRQNSFLRMFRLSATVTAPWDCLGLVSFAAGLLLTTLILNVQPGLSITNSTLVQLGQALPDLKYLSFDEGETGPFIGNLTLDDVVDLLHICPTIEDLTITFNATSANLKPGLTAMGQIVSYVIQPGNEARIRNS